MKKINFNKFKKYYRPDIEALRGISVISVLIYHAKFIIFDREILSGGFLGVDIFFLITGFLITGILLKEFKEEKKINITQFYQRRIRRIVPILLFVLLTSSFLSLMVLDPVKLKQFSLSLFSSLLFVSNAYFHYFGDFYGNNVNLTKPLLHLWSLGVEEQFYIFYPLVLIFILKFFKKYLFHFLLAGIATSLLFAEFASTDHKMFSFYMLPSRAWEILIGSLLAYLISYKKFTLNVSNKTKSFLYLFSLITILYCFLFFNINEIKHPSFLTVLPLLATSIIILLGKEENKVKKLFSYKIFSNNILIFFGSISFSLYLWHFLLFAIYRNSYLEETNVVKVLIILLSILLSFLSYIFIENKYRNRNIEFKKVKAFIIILLIPIISINTFYFLDNKILNKNYVVDGVNLTQWKDTNLIIKIVKKENIKSFPKNDKINVLILGDCNADDIFLALNHVKNKFNNYNFALFPRISAIEITKPLFYNKFIKENLYKDSDIIILSSRWRYSATSRSTQINFLDGLINKIKQGNKKIIIMNNNPEFNYIKQKIGLARVNLTNYGQKLLETKSANFSSEEILVLKMKYFDQYSKNYKLVNVNKKIKDIAENHSIKLFDKTKFICDDSQKTCSFRMNTNNDEIYRDNSRFSLSGIKILGDYFFKIKLFKNL